MDEMEFTEGKSDAPFYIRKRAQPSLERLDLVRLALEMRTAPTGPPTED